MSPTPVGRGDEASLTDARGASSVSCADTFPMGEGLRRAAARGELYSHRKEAWNGEIFRKTERSAIYCVVPLALFIFRSIMKV